MQQFIRKTQGSLQLIKITCRTKDTADIHLPIQSLIQQFYSNIKHYNFLLKKTVAMNQLYIYTHIISDLSAFSFPRFTGESVCNMKCCYIIPYVTSVVKKWWNKLQITFYVYYQEFQIKQWRHFGLLLLLFMLHLK